MPCRSGRTCKPGGELAFSACEAWSASRRVFGAGDPPHGNTVNRASLEGIFNSEPEIVSTHLMEGIGIALDPAHNRMFVTDLGGNIYVAALDGSGHRPIRALQGNLTGIAYAELPQEI